MTLRHRMAVEEHHISTPERYAVPIYRLKLVPERVEMFAAPDLTATSAAHSIIEDLIGAADREHIAVVFVDARLVPTGVHIAAMGTVLETVTTVREIFKGAIVANALGIVVGHNHVSSDPMPSRGDVLAARRIQRAGKLLGIKVLDDIIVTKEGLCTSLRELGVLDRQD